jgi:hypothetical protein
VARPGSPSYHGLPSRAYSGVVSIGETPGFPGGSGSSGFYNPVYGIYMPYESYRGVSNHRPLTTNEKGALLALSTLYLPISIVRGAGLGTAALWKLTRLTGILGLGYSDSPGGGGPGHSLTSTNPPPSVEATGASLAQHGKTEGPARSSKRGSRHRRFSDPAYMTDPKCPRGYYWDYRKRKCVKRRKY